MFHHDFLVAMLGKGKFGEVFQAKHQETGFIATKVNYIFS